MEDETNELIMIVWWSLNSIMCHVRGINNKFKKIKSTLRQVATQ